MDRIRIEGVRAYGRHGFEHERLHPQPFDVDVALHLDASEAIGADDLGRTIDYALVIQEIRRVVDEESFSLIETLSAAIADRLLGFGPKRVEVRVSKPVAALGLGAEAISVEVARERG